MNRHSRESRNPGPGRDLASTNLDSRFRGNDGVGIPFSSRRPVAPSSFIPLSPSPPHPTPARAISIHEVPNRSRNIAKRLANGVVSIFMKISPPSVSWA